MFREMGHKDEAALRALAKASLPLLRRQLTENSYRGWLAVDGKKIVGGAGLWIHEVLSHPESPKITRRAYVFNVYVEPEYRRRGLARKMMDAIVEHTRKLGFTTLWLHASDDGRSLYEQMGFVPTNEMKLKLK